MRILLAGLLAFGATLAVVAELVKLDNIFDLKEVAFVKQPGTATVQISPSKGGHLPVLLLLHVPDYFG